MKRLLPILSVVAVCASTAISAERTFTVVTSDDLVNHWPGADGFLGTADDPVDADPSEVVGSDANTAGTFGFMTTLLTFFPTDPDPYLFGQWNTVTYVEGSATIDTEAFLADDVPLLTEVELDGTQLFQGHGLYSLSLTNPTGGTYSRSGNVFTFSSIYDFEGTFGSTTGAATGALADGTAILIDAVDYSAPDLNAAPADLAAYVLDVAIPLAQERGASGLLVFAADLETSGSPGVFPPLDAYGVSVSLEMAAVVEEVRFSDIGLVPEGVRMVWSEVDGRTYAIEAADEPGGTFATIASNLPSPEFIDTEFDLRTMRYYRVRLE